MAGSAKERAGARRRGRELSGRTREKEKRLGRSHAKNRNITKKCEARKRGCDQILLKGNSKRPIGSCCPRRKNAVIGRAKTPYIPPTRPVVGRGWTPDQTGARAGRPHAGATGGESRPCTPDGAENRGRPNNHPHLHPAPHPARHRLRISPPAGRLTHGFRFRRVFGPDRLSARGGTAARRGRMWVSSARFLQPKPSRLSASHLKIAASVTDLLPPSLGIRLTSFRQI